MVAYSSASCARGSSVPCEQSQSRAPSWGTSSCHCKNASCIFLHLLASSSRCRSSAVGGHQYAANSVVTAAAAVAEASPAPLEAPINGFAGNEPADSSPEPKRIDRPIRVADKPAANALTRRLETVSLPQHDGSFACMYAFICFVNEAMGCKHKVAKRPAAGHESASGGIGTGNWHICMFTSDTSSVGVAAPLQAPQTLIRASTNSDQHTYKTIATIATAQKQLKQPSKVLLYVPFTKSSTFTALVLPASDSVLQNPTNSSSSPSNAPKLTVKASTDAKALANTLTFDLIKKGSAELLSAGAAATAKAAAALTIVREQLLSRGYEVGVLPRFNEGQGKEQQVGSCRTFLPPMMSQ